MVPYGRGKPLPYVTTKGRGCSDGRWGAGGVEPRPYGMTDGAACGPMWSSAPTNFFTFHYYLKPPLPYVTTKDAHSRLQALLYFCQHLLDGAPVLSCQPGDVVVFEFPALYAVAF